MTNLFDYKKYQSLHFIGVGGVSMSALAEYVLSEGKSVSGSDLNLTEVKTRLSKKGATLYRGHSKDNVKNAKIVVVSSAINKNNPEIFHAQKIGLPIIKRSQLLGQILSEHKKVVAVCGSHGKTTTTAMISRILIDQNLDPTVFLGGYCDEFGNFRYGGKQIAVAEVCEYQKNLLDVVPDISVVLNVDNDHMECYKDMDELIGAFNEFSSRGFKIINADDENSKRLNNLSTLTFGINSPAHFVAKNLKQVDGVYSFTVYVYGIKQERINLGVKGKHNVYNALASYALASILDVPTQAIKKSLESFSGVKRRNERVGDIFGMEVVCDYAHHPKEIAETIKTFRESGKKFGVIFQPHTFSRTKNLMEDFIETLKEVDDLFVYKTYPAREKYDKQGSARMLAENLNLVRKNTCYYLKNKEELIKSFADMKGKVEVIVVLGAGDLYQTIKKVIKQQVKRF